MPPFFAYARLRVPGHFPWNGRQFGVGTDVPGYEIVDLRDSWVNSLIGDGSIVIEAPTPPPSPAPETVADETL